MEELEQLKKSINRLGETFDRGFERQEAQAKRHFGELVAKIDENTSAETKRFDELNQRRDELMKLTLSPDRSSLDMRSGHPYSRWPFFMITSSLWLGCGCELGMRR